jgi:hypothetical protein
MHGLDLTHMHTHKHSLCVCLWRTVVCVAEFANVSVAHRLLRRRLFANLFVAHCLLRRRLLILICMCSLLCFISLCVCLWRTAGPFMSVCGAPSFASQKSDTLVCGAPSVAPQTSDTVVCGTAFALSQTHSLTG